jgi:hypothetical protein
VVSSELFKLQKGKRLYVGGGFLKYMGKESIADGVCAFFFVCSDESFRLNPVAAKMIMIPVNR